MSDSTRTSTVNEVGQPDRIRLRFTPFLYDQHEAMEKVTSGLAHRIFHYLSRLRDFTTNQIRISQRRIAEHFSVSLSGVKKALGQLRDAGVLGWGGPHRHAATYTLTGLYRRDYQGSGQSDAVEPSGHSSGSQWGTRVTTISRDSWDQTPPLPPAVSEPVELVPGDGEGEIPSGDSAFGGGADAPVIDEDAGLMDSRTAEDRVDRDHPVPEKPSRQDVESLVQGALVLQPGEASPLPDGPQNAVDADTLPVTPRGAVLASDALLGRDPGVHGVYAREQIMRLAGMGDLTPRMLVGAYQDATDHRGTGYTRFVAEVVRRLHASRLSSRRRERLDAIRADRLRDDGTPPPAPRTRWVADLVTSGGLVGEALNSEAYRDLADRRVACPA